MEPGGPEPRSRVRRRAYWIAVATAIMVGCLTYLLVPQLVWVWKSVQQMNAATATAAALIGQPKADWQTTDLDGATHALADYRGQVVLLDFWFSACGWCQRATPQIVALAEEFKDQPVVVLGVNSDEAPDDARRMINDLGITYLTLKDQQDGTPIHQLYKITMWPAMVVLDREGVVRHVHCGYWPSLQSELSGKIRELIEQPSATFAAGQ